MTWPLDDWLRVAVKQFGLSPKEFWAMSVRDWRALIGENALSPLSRDSFEQLQSLFPDGGCDEFSG